MSAPSLATALQYKAEAKSRTFAHVDLAGLNALAVRSLGLLYDEAQTLFAKRLTKVDGSIRVEGISTRGTLVALLGLQRLAESGAEVPFDIAGIRDRVLCDMVRQRRPGDVGLLAWLAAEREPDRLGDFWSESDFWRDLQAFTSGLSGGTQELSLFLAGIAHLRLGSGDSALDLTDVAVATYQLLKQNQGESGLFSRGRTPVSRGAFLYRRFGTFGDQIHAIYALSKFATAFAVDEPLEAALSCANTICSLQGDQGQWWSVYETRRGSVARRYPVLSEYQDGAAPVALFALAEAAGQDFHEHIQKGLMWLTGANELAVDLRDAQRALIWDAIEHGGKMAKYRETVLNLVKFSRSVRPATLRVRHEIRPEHLGWLLYAFGENGLPTRTARSVTA